MANDYFRFKKFTILQDKCAMKVTTLACIQGAWLPVQRPGRILDIGAGTGLLSLMAAQKYNVQIDAVEIEAAAYHQLLENINASPWKEKVTAHQANILDYAGESRLNFDLVISNPPFYNDQLTSPDSRVNLARHHTGLQLETLIEIIDTILTSRGKASLLLPPEESNILKDLIRPRPLFVSNQLIIHDRNDRPAKAIVSILSRSAASNQADTLVIKTETDAYSNEFKSLLGDYYLNL